MVKITKPKPIIIFTCRKCLTEFITDEWRPTDRGMSYDCPCCHYSCWKPRP